MNAPQCAGAGIFLAPDAPSHTGLSAQPATVVALETPPHTGPSVRVAPANAVQNFLASDAPSHTDASAPLSAGVRRHQVAPALKTPSLTAANLTQSASVVPETRSATVALETPERTEPFVTQNSGGSARVFPSRTLGPGRIPAVVAGPKAHAKRQEPQTRAESDTPGTHNPSFPGNGAHSTAVLPPTELRRIAASLRFLSLCGGPDRPDGIDKYVRELGANIDVYDLEITPEHNLLDDCVWKRIKADFESGKYDSGGAAPPCSTFSTSRRWGEGVPSPLRGEFAPEI